MGFGKVFIIASAVIVILTMFILVLQTTGDVLKPNRKQKPMERKSSGSKIAKPKQTGAGGKGQATADTQAMEEEAKSVLKTNPYIYTKDLDEFFLGVVFYEYLKPQAKKDKKTQTYLQEVLNSIVSGSRKDIYFKILIFNGHPNIYALPGGIIIITEKMLELIDSESQLVSLLAHEIHHLDKEECFQKAMHLLKGEKRKKIRILEILDILYKELPQTPFETSQEEQANANCMEFVDEYLYDPYSLYEVTEKLIKYQDKSFDAGDFTSMDAYLVLHPNLSERLKYYEKQLSYWKKENPNKTPYQGKLNYRKKIPRPKKFYPGQGNLEISP